MSVADNGLELTGAPEDGVAQRVEVPAGRRGIIVTAVIAGIIFAWSVYAAIGNVIQVPQTFDLYRQFVAKNGAPELAKTTPWPALIAALVVPVLGYLVALRLGRGCSLVRRIIVFVLMYAAVSALTVSLTAYVFQESSLL